MNTVHRNLLLYEAYRMTDTLIQHIQHLPNGYKWWCNLPDIGKSSQQSTRRKWAHFIVAQCFPTHLIHALILASVNSNGYPDERGTALYEWLLKHVYHGDVKLFYAQWLQVKGDTT